MFDGESVRYAAYDGELSDLDSDISSDLIPWISSEWSKSFTWRGNGTMPETERKKLLDIVEKAHRHGRKVRFWGSPDKPPFWRELLQDNVDLINTDDLEGAQRFLLENSDKNAR
jgi:hypothetical protein